mgnify:CR=1 FL=1
MAELKNVGRLDAVIRIVLGAACVGVLVYNFAVERLMPIYAAIPVFVLVPFFLKTGITRACPLMKSLNLSTSGTLPMVLVGMLMIGAAYARGVESVKK